MLFYEHEAFSSHNFFEHALEESFQLDFSLAHF